MGMIYAPPSVIPNGALINGVCHIYQSTKPTTRPDGSALVIGDIAYNPTTGLRYFWNGLYWVGDEKIINFSTTNSIVIALILMYPINPATKIITSSFDFHCLSQSTHDASNYFGCNWQLQNANNGVENFSTFMTLNTQNQAVSTNQTYSQVVSSYADMSSYKGFRVTIPRLGTASGWVGFRLAYREVW